jgi:hypothetical protein
MLTYYEDEGVIVTLSDEGFARLAAEAARSTRTARRHETFVKLAALVVVTVILIWGLK